MTANVSYISVMTEIYDTAVQSLAVREFVLRWGDMGGQWGVNRSVAQIHALLYLSEQPMTAEAIAGALGIARSNVSNSLKELLGWRLIRRVPILGDRRDHYEAEGDLWQMAFRIAQGRKQREIDPILAALHDVAAAAKTDRETSPAVRARLDAMQGFVQTVDDWYQQMASVPPAKLMSLMKMGSKIVRFLGLRQGG
jgi:DNA-binding transcriptional regulator GbsR (MarR family)